MRQPNETSTICHFLAARMAERGCRTNHTMQICQAQQYMKGLRIQTPNSGNRRCSFRDTGQPGGTWSLAVRIVISTRRSTDMKELDIGIAMIEACKMRKQKTKQMQQGRKTFCTPFTACVEGYVAVPGFHLAGNIQGNHSKQHKWFNKTQCPSLRVFFDWLQLRK